MADLDFDQIPAQEQMVDNWGQPTPWMQALWQRLTEQIRDQLGRLNMAQDQLASAQASLTTQGAALAAQGATLASTVDDLEALGANLAALALNFSDLDLQQGLINVQIFTKFNQLLAWVNYLDDNGAVHYPGAKPGPLA
jgi:type II secretory pathway component PulM